MAIPIPQPGHQICGIRSERMTSSSGCLSTTRAPRPRAAANALLMSHGLLAACTQTLRVSAGAAPTPQLNRAREPGLLFTLPMRHCLLADSVDNWLGRYQGTAC